MTVVVILVMLAMFACGQQYEIAKRDERHPKFEPHVPRFLSADPDPVTVSPSDGCEGGGRHLSQS